MTAGPPFGASGLFDRFALGSPAPVLHGERVYLRPPQASDWAAWARVRAESREFLTPWEPIWSADALSRGAFRLRLRLHQRDARSDTGYAFLIFRRSDNALLGGITLANVRRGITQAGSIGYWIGKSFARQGFMTEAVRVVLRHSFGDLALHRIEAACLPSNTASRTLLRRLGFVEEGYAREYLRINGVWADHLLFGLLATDRTATWVQA